MNKQDNERIWKVGKDIRIERKMIGKIIAAVGRGAWKGKRGGGQTDMKMEAGNTIHFPRFDVTQKQAIAQENP